MIVTQELCLAAPELRGAARALGQCQDLEVCLDGPAGTGKSFAALYKVHMMLTLFAGSKWLLARKTNTALAGSAVATFRDLLHSSENVQFFGGNKIRPAAFEYPNGSVLIVNGLDKPDKVKSWEFDGALINEASECTLEDIEFVRTRLRHGKGPYHQLIMDTNPGPPTHWLNQRMIKGITTRLTSRHKDNPRYFDEKTQDWTPEGRDYIFGTLGGLTGVRYLRLLKGIWASADGLVYEDFDRATHLVTKQQLIDWYLLYEDGSLNRTKVRRVLGGADWGYTNPGVLHVYLIDNDERVYLFHEVYRTKRTIDWWLVQGKQLQEQYGVERWICDPAEPAFIQQFNNAGLPAVGAENAIAPGIGFLQTRLKVAGDGRPRFYVYEYALQDRDESLEQAHKPYCFEQEIDAYVWAQNKDGKPMKEQPVDDANHALDVSRYLATFLAKRGFRSVDTQIAVDLYNYTG